jgi:hypothetical protein
MAPQGAYRWPPAAILHLVDEHVVVDLLEQLHAAL